MLTNNLIARYYEWLRDKTVFKEGKDIVEITTPYLNAHNDYIQIYLKKDGENYILSDEGETIAELEMYGCSLETGKRGKILNSVLQGFGVSQKNGAIQTTASVEDFPLKKHCLLQALLSVSDMFFLSDPYIKSIFYEDVRDWLDAYDIRFSKDIIFKGLSGFDRKFDFVIPKSKKASERLVKTINNPTKNAVDLFIMDWLDTKDGRSEEASAFVIVNDTQKPVEQPIQQALENYGIRCCPWSKRESVREKLCA